MSNTLESWNNNTDIHITLAKKIETLEKTPRNISENNPKTNGNHRIENKSHIQPRKDSAMIRDTKEGFNESRTRYDCKESNKTYNNNAKSEKKTNNKNQIVPFTHEDRENNPSSNLPEDHTHNFIYLHIEVDYKKKEDKELPKDRVKKKTSRI